jgi:DNA invertase Pin-like site-specific DNA recombinase
LPETIASIYDNAKTLKSTTEQEDFDAILTLQIKRPFYMQFFYNFNNKSQRSFFMVYAYVRVSTDKQTVENQRFEINNYCAAKNIKIDVWINETISGKEPFEKRKLGKLLKTIKKGDTLICSELSRLSRAMYSILSALEKCENYGVQIITIKECLALKKDDMSRYFATMIAIFSDMERSQISRRTKEALARLKYEGVKLGRPQGSKSKSKKLTGKEILIMKMKKEKMTLKQIAKKLKVSERTLHYFIAENTFFSKKQK